MERFETKIERVNTYGESALLKDKNNCIDAELSAVVYWGVEIDMRTRGIKSIDTYIEKVVIDGTITECGEEQDDERDFHVEIPGELVKNDLRVDSYGGLMPEYVDYNFETKECEVE